MRMLQLLGVLVATVLLAPLAPFSVGPAAASHNPASVPTFRMGIDPITFTPPYNWGADGNSNTGRTLCIGAAGLGDSTGTCFYFFLEAGSSGSLHKPDIGRAEAYAVGLAVDPPVGGLIKTGASAGLKGPKVLKHFFDLLAQVQPDDNPGAWAAVGQVYNLAKGCNEQSSTFGVPVRIVGQHRAKANIWAGAGGIGGGAAYAKTSLAHSRGPNFAMTPAATARGVEVGQLVVGVENLFPALWVRQLPIPTDTTKTVTLDTMVTPGKQASYMSVSADAIAESIVLGWGSGASDVIGNEFMDLHRLSVSWPDDSPPISTTNPTNAAGWFTGPVTVEVSSQDPQTCVREIQYKVDTGAWQTVSVDPMNPKTSFTVSGNGVHTVAYRAVNHAGETEYAKELKVKIASGPTVWDTTSSGTAGENGWYTSNVVRQIDCTGDGGALGLSAWINGAAATVSMDTSVNGRGRVTVSTEGRNLLTYECYYKFDASKPKGRGSSEVIIDKGKPTITFEYGCPADWKYVGTIQLYCRSSPLSFRVSAVPAAPDVSGVASCRYKLSTNGALAADFVYVAPGQEVPIAADGRYRVSYQCKDRAGLWSDTAMSTDRVLDTQVPTSGDPAPEGSFVEAGSPLAPKWVYWAMANERHMLHIDDVRINDGAVFSDSFSDGAFDANKWVRGSRTNSNPIDWTGAGATVQEASGELQVQGALSRNAIAGLKGVQLADGQSVKFRAKYSGSDPTLSYFWVSVSGSPTLTAETGYPVELHFRDYITTSYQEFELRVSGTAVTLYKGGTPIATGEVAGPGARWYTATTPVTFPCTDPSPGSSCDVAWYSLGQAAYTWKSYIGGTSQISVAAEGCHRIEHYVADNAGHAGPTYLLPEEKLCVDKTAPRTVRSASQPLRSNNWFWDDVRITLTCDDAKAGVGRVSGCARIEYRLNGQDAVSAANPTNVDFGGEGVQGFEYRSVDRAGNAETWQRFDVKIDRNNPVATLARPRAGCTYEVDVEVCPGLVANPVVVGPMRVSGSAHDRLAGTSAGSGLQRVQLKVVSNGGAAFVLDDTTWSERGEFGAVTRTADWTNAKCRLLQTSHDVVATAWDWSGRSASQTVRATRADCTA